MTTKTSHDESAHSLCLDGNTACAMMAYSLIDMAAIYPITPSSTMAELIEQYSAQGRKNAFGNVVAVHQTQSELGAAACVHGGSNAGSLASSFTSSQGLLLMIPNLYFLAASRQPVVIHLACRSVGMSSTSLSPDHSDLYAVSQTNMSAIISRNVQEAHDMALVTHLAAQEASAAFIHCFEGFRVSHQFESFHEIPMDTVKSLINYDAIQQFKDASVHSTAPDARGIGLGPELYYQAFEANKVHFNSIAKIVAKVMEKVSAKIGRTYKPFEYVGHPEAEEVLVLMSSAALTAEAVVEALVREGRKVGVLNVRLWRPFDAEFFLAALPKTVKKLCVMDRARDFVSNGELLYKEILAVASKHGVTFEQVKNVTYGIAGHDLAPGEVLACFESFKKPALHTFRLGVNDPETVPTIDATALKLLHEKTKELVVYAIGADGTIGAIRNSMKILQDQMPSCQSQANFEFDGKKSGGITISYLRFGPEKIKTQFNPETAEYVACHTQSYVGKYDFLKHACKGAIFVLNADYKDVDAEMPAELKRQIAAKDVELYVVNASKIAHEVGLRNRTSPITIMFLMALGMRGLLDLSHAADSLKALTKITYAKQPQAVIDANMRAIDVTLGLVDSCRVQYDKAKWLEAKEEIATAVVHTEELLQPGGVYDKLLHRKFQDITTADAARFASGIYPPGFSKFERPGVADAVATWSQDNCIQCNFCASACPHGCIRPFASPAGGQVINVSPLDCRGCEVCAEACPKKCITMQPLASQNEAQAKWDEAVKNGNKTISAEERQKCSLKELETLEPYLFSPGSCPGCPETVIARMLMTLYGDHLVVSSAVGCCLVWGHFNQFRPYQVDKEGCGPAVATSAFEDNATFGLGLAFSDQSQRKALKLIAEKAVEDKETHAPVRDALSKWLSAFDKPAESRAAKAELLSVLKETQHETDLTRSLKLNAHFMPKQTHWIIGGDGWAYDIDFAGIDHVMASGVDVNVLVFNNNCFANTGGQFSKATPQGAVAKHAYNGVELGHKRMSEMFMTYRRCYVAQVALGANRMQTLKAIREAGSYPGPSLVIAYCPCIAHTIQGGLKNSEKQQKLAVETGIWPLFRYDPRVGKLQMDSQMTKPVVEFTKNEQRFASLEKKDAVRFARLQAELQADVEAAFANLKKMAE